MRAPDWWIAAAVGLVVAGLWWLFSGCRRSVELQKVVKVARLEVYRFLRDPNNLKIMHPRTTGIRMESEKEDNHLTELNFVWMEEVPFPVESRVRMTCDPATFTICWDISPPTGTCNVHLTWAFDDATTHPATEAGLSSNGPDMLSSSDEKTEGGKYTDPNPDGSFSKSEPSEKNKSDGVSPNMASGGFTGASENHAEKELTNAGGMLKKNERTFFRNTITVSGPRAFVFVILKIVPKMQQALMDNLKRHLERTR